MISLWQIMPHCLVFLFFFLHHIICLSYYLNRSCPTNCFGKIINGKNFNWHLKFCQIKKRAIEGHENAFIMVLYQNMEYMNATMLKQIINKNLFNIKLSAPLVFSPFFFNYLYRSCVKDEKI